MEVLTSQVAQLIAGSYGGQGGFRGQRIRNNGGQAANAAAQNPNNSKGRGKGNSKGNGKGPSPAPVTPPPPAGNDEWQTQTKQKWKCKWNTCESGMNNANRQTCYKCGKSKNAALHPPQPFRREDPAAADPKAQPAAQPDGPTRAQKRNERRAANRNRDGQKPPDASRDASKDEMDISDSEDLDGTEAGLELAKDEIAIMATLGLTPIGKASSLTGTFAKPQPKQNAASPEEEVASACGKNDALAEAQTNVAFYTAELAAISSVEAKAQLVPVIKSALKEAEDKVATLSKGNKTVSLVTLQRKRANEMETEEKRTTSATNLREKAQLRYDRYLAALKGEFGLFQKRIDELEEAFKESSQAWVEKDLELAKAHTARLAAWDSRITAAEAASGGSLTNMATTSGVLPAPGMSAAAVLGVTTPATASPATLPVAPFVAPAGTICYHPDCYITVPWSPSDLPKITQELNENEEEVLSCVSANIRAWQCNGTIPASFKMLTHGLIIEESHVVAAFQRIIGPKIWGDFYGSRSVGPADFVPAQLGQIIREALDRIGELLMKSKHSKKCVESAGKVFSKHLKDETKRRKAAAAPAVNRSVPVGKDKDNEDL